VWYPKRKIDVDKLERVQKRATKLIAELSKKSYSDWLKTLKLPTLKYRWYRGDMIELFKIVNGIYDPACVPHFEYTELTDNWIRTIGNKFKLVQHHCYYDLRKYNLLTASFPYGILCLIMSFLLKLLTPSKPFRLVLVGSRSTVWLQNRSPWHREPQYSLLENENYLYI